VIDVQQLGFFHELPLVECATACLPAQEYLSIRAKKPQKTARFARTT
jgi:hypothetical protein